MLTKQTGKNFVANVISGGLYFFVTGLILAMIGGFIGIENASDFNQIASLIASYDLVALGFALLILLVVGLLVLAFAWVNVKLHKVFGDKTKFDFKFNKRPAVLVIIGAGFIWLWIIVGLNAFFGAFGAEEQINILDATTLLTALLALRFDILAVTAIGLAVTGFLLRFTVMQMPKVQDKLPKKTTEYI